MKKIFLLIALWVLTLPVFAQNAVSISGTVIDNITGYPLVMHPVTIQSADSISGFYYFNVVYTNPNGYFQDSMQINPLVPQGTVDVTVVDCQQYPHLVSLPYEPGNMSLTATFSICSFPSGCDAAFYYTSAGTALTLNFYEQSVGGNGIRFWDFGDGTTSTLADPVHTFPVPGYYVVNLTIGAQGTTCWDQEIMTIWVGDSIPNGCQAAFSYTTIPGSMLIQFVDQSVATDSISWQWNFGDPTSGTMNSSTVQNPTHQYSAVGGYMVCLIISGNNCSDTICMQVVVNQQQGCIADFEALPAPNTMSTFLFNDISQGDIQSWTWNFGDGTTQTIAFPNNPDVTHTYPVPGNYYACLSVQGNDSLCSDIKCLTIFVGDTLPDCIANFTYANVPGSSPNVFQFTDASIYSGPVSWFWNFDDGTVSTEQNPLHIFPAGPVIDPYFVCLTITSGDSICTNTICLPVIPQYQGCQALFEALPAPDAPLTINFVDQSLGENLSTWIWDFGDGNTQTVVFPNIPDVSHTYQEPGFYSVCLTVHSDSGLCYSSYCETVALFDSIPQCQAQYSYYADPTTGIANAITFIDLSLGNPTQWYWEFGDPASGIANVTTEQNPVHAFSAPGTYYVCLTVSGPDCQSVWCGDVEVGPVTFCVNYFTYTQIGQSINFEGYMVNGVSEMYAWDFGDNQVGTGQNVVHTYDVQGTYFVTLTTMDPATGCTYTSSQVVSVGDSTLWGQIYGQVFSGNFPITQGMVYLISIDTSSSYMPFVDISLLDSSGVYYFPMVPQGNYVIYAIPFEIGLVPTYYGDVLNWENATVVQLGTPNNPYNINLIQSSGYQGGNGTIGGQVVQQGDFSNTMIDKITMLLKDESGNTILYSLVDDSGNFNFPQLAYGTYYLYAELAGCETEAVQVVISETNPTSTVILTLSGNSILGINDKPIELEAGVVYPNPIRTEAQITVKLKTASILHIELYALSGQMVYTENEPASIGENTIVIPASQLTDGVYMLKIYTEEGLMLTRKLVKTK